MDWVQWYMAAVIATSTALALYLDGEPKEEPRYCFASHFMGLLVALPYIGRIFHWW
jgi:hypothetical protein